MSAAAADPAFLDVLKVLIPEDKRYLPVFNHGVSASSVGPTILCPTRAVLPQVRDTGEAAVRGNELHEFARLVTENPGCREAALAAVPEDYRHTAEGMNLAGALDGLEVLGCEMAYALNVQTRTTRFIGRNIGRNYGAIGKYEIPFTIDVEAVVDGVPVELDYKSGKNIGPVKEHWQRRVCATGLMFFHDTASAISRVAYIWEDGSIHPAGDEFNIFEAEDYCDEMLKMLDAVYAAEAKLYGGEMPTTYPSDDACKYCPAMMSCPAMTNFAKAMLGKLEAIEKGPELSTLAPAELLEVWETAKRAAVIAETVIDSLKVLAEKQAFGNEEYEVRGKAKDGKAYFDAGKARGLITVLLGKLGAEDEEIKNQIAGLMGKGKEYTEYRKYKVKP